MRSTSISTMQNCFPPKQRMEFLRLIFYELVREEQRESSPSLILLTLLPIHPLFNLAVKSINKTPILSLSKGTDSSFPRQFGSENVDKGQNCVLLSW